jgi:hypothetical protein
MGSISLEVMYDGCRGRLITSASIQTQIVRHRIYASFEDEKERELYIAREVFFNMQEGESR